MQYLNAQQLAFILDITKEDARARMCNAWTREKGLPKDDLWGGVGTRPKDTKRAVASRKIEDPYPQAMPIEMISRQLNLPDLQTAVNDIISNYLKRPGSRKWILADYPEKVITKAERECKLIPYTISIPPALKSMLPNDAIQAIHNEWLSRFKTIDMKPKLAVK